jgi:2-polyprenyl-6-methoxyphenol hydroxylase-like FAD-dependent oxidoreductase
MEPCTGEVILAKEGSAETEEVKVVADIVVGADGAGSKCRRLLQELVCFYVKKDGNQTSREK